MSGLRILHISGRGLVLRGADVDTDRIIPARFLRAISFAGIERSVFADDRVAMAKSGQRHPFDEPPGGSRILVVNNNFGCGSSREHAPQALQRWGVTAIVGASFADIFFSNSVMLGLPCVSMAEADVGELMASIEHAANLDVSIDIATCAVTAGSRRWQGTIPSQAKDALTSGHWDGVGLLLDNYDDVSRVDAALTYGRP